MVTEPLTLYHCRWEYFAEFQGDPIEVRATGPRAAAEACIAQARPPTHRATYVEVVIGERSEVYRLERVTRWEVA